VEEVAQHGMNDRCGLLVNSSRGILYAAGKEASQEDAIRAAARVAEDLAAQMGAELSKRDLL
jgi:orotidine-5'-phosphate decarboxylase